MAIFSGPEIPNNGLVFHYDMGNSVKSWKGAPVVNLAPYTDYSNRSYNTVYDIGGFGGDDADVYYYRNGGYNDLPYKKMIKHTGGTGGSYINEHSYFTLTEGVTYNISCYMRANVATTVSGHTLALNRDSDNAYRVPADISLTTDWVKKNWTYTCAIGEGGTTYHFRQIVYNDTQLPLEVYWCGLQIAVGTVTYPYVNGTRSNTQAIIDLTNNRTITANGLTYASDGTFSFNGSTNNLAITNPVTSNLPYTILQWVKPAAALTDTVVTTGTGRKTPLVGPGPQWSPGYWLTARNFRVHAFTEYRDHTIDWVGSTSWHMIGQVFDGTNCFGIIDGVILSGGVRTAYSPGSQTTILIGAENTTGNEFNWNGRIDSTQIYNRVLSATEVRQNFEAARGRYGI